LNTTRPTDWLLLLVLCAIGVGLGNLQNGARSRGAYDFVSGGVQQVVSPPAALVTSVADGVSDFSSGVFGGSGLQRELRDLRAQNIAASMYQDRIDLLQRELEALRRLHSTPAYGGKQKVPARIVGFFPLESRISISVGADKGLKPGVPVVSAGGLVGVVQAVNPRTAHVLLLSSPGLKIGAVATRNPPIAGLLKGESATALILELMDPKAPIELGDAIVTSGYSDNIPFNIPIGRVIQVDDNPEFGTRRAYVFPNVSIGSVREVYVLL
jgi:rod shape-determining protein MreC